MSTGLSERLRLLVGGGRGGSELLISLVLQFVNVQLLDLPTAHAHRPAVRSGDIGTERSRLGCVAHRGR